MAYLTVQRRFPDQGCLPLSASVRVCHRRAAVDRLQTATRIEASDQLAGVRVERLQDQSLEWNSRRSSKCD